MGIDDYDDHETNFFGSTRLFFQDEYYHFSWLLEMRRIIK
jgi:hypothetical protein